MTTEIAILNKSAIALAADSAVTFTTRNGHSKIYNTVNKLFALSKYHPVGVMVFDNAELMGIPWETIIKIYRSKLGKKRFATLKQYSDHFVNFLNDNQALFPQKLQADYYADILSRCYSEIRESALQKCDEHIKLHGKIEDSKVSEILGNQVHYYYQKFSELKDLESLPNDFGETVKAEYQATISNARDQVFGKVGLPDPAGEELHAIAGFLIAKNFFPDIGNSGIVVAGFGESEPFPSLYSFIIQGIVANKVKHRPFKESVISFKRGAIITSFAQDEMVHTFMEGVDPSYEEFIGESLREVFSKYCLEPINVASTMTPDEKAEVVAQLREIEKAARAELRKKLDDYKRKNYINSVLEAVGALPKDELAAMAESLVNLTVLKRKVSMTLETVGGAIDVAVISKGDGLIWIKRKHYFSQEGNAQFLANYYRKDEDL